MSEPASLGLAARTLAFVCDGAATHDGAGFSAFDADFGHRLAVTPEDRWSPKMRWAAWKMLRKYRQQLGNAGIDFNAIATPPDPSMADPGRPPAAHHVPRAPVPKKITLEKDRFILSFPYDPAMVATVKRFQTRRFDAAKKQWIVPADMQGTAEVAQFAHDGQFELDPAARERIEGLVAEIKQERERREALLEASNAPEAEFHVDGLAGTLRPYQMAAVKYAAHCRRPRVLIADQVGLGKTMEDIGIIQYFNAYPALIIPPAAVKINWYRQLRKWLPDKTVQVLDGNRPLGYYADIYVVNFDLLQPSEEYLASKKRTAKNAVPKRRRRVDHVSALKKVGLQSISIDEIHNIKNKKTQRAQAIFELTEHADPPVRLGLSGTPLLNRPEELIAQLEFLGVMEELFGSAWKFRQRYCAAQHTGFGVDSSGASNLEELNQILRSNCYIRRLQRDVLKDLPAQLPPEMVPIDIDNREEYSRAEAELVEWMGEQAIKDREFLDSIAYLLIGTDDDLAEYEARLSEHRSSAEERARNAEHLVRISALKQLAARGKMAAAKEWISEFMASGESLLVFAHHTAIVKEIASMLHCPTIMGETDIKTRQRAIDSFRDRKVSALALNIDAGGTGIDGLQYGGSRAAFLEFPWSPGKLDQAIGRLARDGQTERVQPYYLIAANTIDEDIMEMLAGKRDTVDRATDGQAADAPERGMLADLSERMLRRVSGFAGQPARETPIGVLEPEPLHGELQLF